jgi:hypothetical protein
MDRLCCAVSVAGLVTIASALAQAQEPDTLSAAQRAGVALARLGAGQVVRVHTRHFGFVVGRVVADSPNVLALDTGGGTRTGILPSDVDSVWVPHGGHAEKGALIGAGMGGLAGGLGAVALGQANCTRCAEGGSFVFGLVVGGAIGAGIGALIGAAVPKWQLRVP